MSSETAGRRRRSTLPEPPQGEIVLQAPPTLPRGSRQSHTQLLFMLPMMLGMGAMSFVYIGRSSGPLTWVFGVLFLGAMGGMVAMGMTTGGAAKKAQINDERRDYLRYLGGLRKQVREVSVRQRLATLVALPDPAQLWTYAGTERMWERRRTDPDFGRVRVGTGPQRLATPLRPPQTAPLEDLDPVASTSLRHFIRTYATVPDMPMAAALRSFARITVSGERAASLGLARALIAQLVTFHSPDDLRVACCVGAERRADWDWLKWLPHCLHRDRTDAAGPVRLYAPDLAGLVEVLGDDLGERMPFSGDGRGVDAAHVVVLLDAESVAPDPRLHAAGVTILDVSGTATAADPPGLELVVDGGRLGMRVADAVRLLGRPDSLDAVDAELAARQLAPFYSARVRGESPLAGTFGLPELLGIGDPRQVDPDVTWQRRSPRDRLRLPVGVGSDGRPVELDLKESAEGGMGPHGLVIGATGSGKSELLRTLVTGLAVTHSSETLNMALIDFKGGATFAGMGALPHTCAVITNLAEEMTLVDRMGDALRGELVRRQELLRAAGNFASVREYERARASGADLRPLPALLVIIDEFSELLSSQPDFIDLFVMIGRLGRSLAVHLLLASQRLEEGRLRGLDSHLSYRVGLRTFSAPESRAVLGVPDAYELPPVPGHAYLKMDTTTLVRFKSAYVSGELPADVPSGRGVPMPAHRRAVAFTLAPEPLPSPVAPVQEATVAGDGTPGAPATSQTIMGAMLGRLAGRGPAAHQIWLPPLADPVTLEAILPPLRVTEARGLCPDGWAGNGRLTVPLSIVDKPFEQRRDLLWVDLSGAAGHVVVAGAPQSGKSTVLRTLVAALALTHTPEEVQFFILDFGGGSLSALAGLPHVSGCATRLDAERCRRMVAEVSTLLAEREALFAAGGIDSMAGFRANPPEPADGRRFGDVFLVVDGWMTLRQEYEQLEDAVTTIAGRGLGFGIHVVLSVNRWMEIRAQVNDMIGTRLELRLGDPTDSAVDRRAAANVPQGSPGRGLTSDRLHCLTALPRIDGVGSAADLAAGVGDLVKRVDAGWRGRRAPAVRLLPRLIPADQVPVGAGRRVPIGVGESDLAPVALDFDADPHFLVFGDIESGKTALLRLMCAGIVATYPPGAARILLVDYRRGLLGTVADTHLLAYAGSEPALAPMMADLAEGLRARLPGPDVTAEQLRNRSWWTGAELFVVVDDYDLVAGPGGNPLDALLGFLPQAKDVGLHLVLARRVGGAARSLYEPVMQRVRELGSPGLVLSGPRDEGQLLGDVKPSLQPPGRGTLVSRRAGVELIQVAWLPPGEG